MSMKSQGLVGSDYELSLLEQAVCLYNSQGQDFYELLAYYMLTEDKKAYLFLAPDYILMGEVRVDKEGEYWHLAYAAHRDPKKTLLLFFELAPFRLDRVEFCRYYNMHKPKMYKWDNLHRIANYGIIAKTSTTSTASTAASSAATSSDTGST